MVIIPERLWLIPERLYFISGTASHSCRHFLDGLLVAIYKTESPPPDCSQTRQLPLSRDILKTAMGQQILLGRKSRTLSTDWIPIAANLGRGESVYCSIVIVSSTLS